MARVIEPLCEMGANISSENNQLPITISPGNLKGGNFNLSLGSAQVKSAIIFAALCADGETKLKEIKKSLENLKLDKMPEIFCEPGRAIVAESGSTIVKVLLKKKQKLYINDGTYGSLFDAGVPNFILPSKMITDGRIVSKKLTSFNFYGPTCDSLDYMKGPFLLPNNIREGDYIELGQLGAYGTTFRTKFNGFYSDAIYQVDDKPILSMYDRKDKFDYLVA